jgi:hypothetical protein
MDGGKDREGQGSGGGGEDKGRRGRRGPGCTGREGGVRAEGGRAGHGLP